MANRRDSGNHRHESILDLMKESSTYQAIVEEGREEGRVQGAIEEARKALVIVGGRRLGWASSQTWIKIAKIDDLNELESLIDRLDHVDSWEALLGDAPTR